MTPISSNICFSDDIADVFPPWPFVNIHLNAPLPVIAVKACLAFHTMLVHCVLVFVKRIMMWCNISCVLVNLGLYLPNIIFLVSSKLLKLQMQIADARHRE